MRVNKSRNSITCLLTVVLAIAALTYPVKCKQCMEIRSKCGIWK